MAAVALSGVDIFYKDAAQLLRRLDQAAGVSPMRMMRRNHLAARDRLEAHNDYEVIRGTRSARGLNRTGPV